jgi:DNA-binding protein H-NS
MQSERLKTLRAQIKRLEQEAERIEQATKPGIAQLQAVIRKYGLTPADVETAMKGSDLLQRKRGVPKGTRLRPKYRNPENSSQTWAGRGLKPAWLVGLLRRGTKLADLSV